MPTAPPQNATPNQTPAPQKRLDFFVIGAQKAGTTALDFLLRQHGTIEMATGKEVHYFDDESLDWKNPPPRPLHARFDWTRPGLLRGEATPVYLYWPNALERLNAYNAQAKLIVCLRHPSFRAFSHWRMETKRVRETFSFEQAIGPAGRARVAAEPGGVHRVFSYVERGFYAAQIQRVLALFAREHVHFLRTDRLWADPETTLAQVQHFLGVPARPLCGEQAYIVPLDSSDLGGMPRGARADLDALYSDDIKTTAALTGLDLADWLSPAYAEPMVEKGMTILTSPTRL
ncbi:MAG: hypothetical protein B7X08_00165 [Acidocella sp. 20-63-7]|nr:MAG: hypothetical protein B7X08_00165 [Acidocella sp. 20-63-7]HQT45639.1 sulfotransferase domain-containing protein [Acidocella sp.]